MALFGLPGALGLPGKTWPWLIAGDVPAAVRHLPGHARTPGGAAPVAPRSAWPRLAVACPVMAFPLDEGITDPPVIALTCLALALLIRFGRAERGGRPRSSGWSAR